MAAILLYTGVLTGLLSALIGLPFVVKLVVSAIVLIPLGFAMGNALPLRGCVCLRKPPLRICPPRNWANR